MDGWSALKSIIPREPDDASSQIILPINLRPSTMFANRLNRIGKCSLRSGIPTCLSPGPQFSLTEGNAAYDGRGRTTTDGCGRKLSISLAVLLRRVGNVRTADTRSWTNAEIAIYCCSISAYNPIKESNISFEHNSQSIPL